MASSFFDLSWFTMLSLFLYFSIILSFYFIAFSKSVESEFALPKFIVFMLKFYNILIVVIYFLCQTIKNRLKKEQKLLFITEINSFSK